VRSPSPGAHRRSRAVSTGWPSVKMSAPKLHVRPWMRLGGYRPPSTAGVTRSMQTRQSGSVALGVFGRAGCALPRRSGEDCGSGAGPDTERVAEPGFGPGFGPGGEGGVEEDAGADLGTDCFRDLSEGDERFLMDRSE